MIWYPQLTPFVLTVVLSIFLVGYALTRTEVRAARTFAWLMVCIAVWAGGYGLAYASTTLEDKYFWTVFKNLGALPAPVIWALLTLQLARMDALLSRRLWLAIAAFVAVLMLSMLTNDAHHLFWIDFKLVPGEIESVSTHGPLFKLWEYCIYVAAPVALIACADYARRAPGVQKTQALLMIAAALVPITGRVVRVVFGVRLIESVDSVPLLLFVSGLMFAVAIFRLGALDVLSIAHRLVVDNIQAGIVVVDPSERVLGINPFARGLCAKGAGDGTPLARALPACAGMPLFDGSEHEVRIDSAGGVERWYLVKVSAVGDDSVGRLGTALMLLDITDRKQMEQTLRAEATTDPLTGVANRRQFFARAEAALERAQGRDEQLAVLLISVDHFDVLTEAQGHRIGDEVLLAAAQTVEHTLREVDVFGRYSPEAFIALSPGIPDVIAGLSRRIRRAVSQAAIDTPGGAVNVTLSIGSAPLREGGLEAAIQGADEALIAARDRGGDQHVSLG